MLLVVLVPRKTIIIPLFVSGMMLGVGWAAGRNLNKNLYYTEHLLPFLGMITPKAPTQLPRDK